MKNKTLIVFGLAPIFLLLILSTVSAQEITATTLVNGSHNRVDNGVTSIFTLPSVSASENSLLLLWVGNSGNLGSVSQPPNPTITSSNGLQWEFVTLMNRGGSRTIWLYRTVSTSTDSFDVTIDTIGSPKEFFWSLQQYENVVIGNNGADAIVQTATAEGGFNFDSLVTLPNPSSGENNAVVGGMFCGCDMDIFPGEDFTTLSKDTDSSLKVADETFSMFTEFQSTFDSTIDASWNGISAHWLLIGLELQLDENATPPTPMPEVTLVSPANNSYTNSQETIFECSATAPNDGVSTLSSLAFYLWDSLGALVDTQSVSVSGNSTSNQFNATLVSEETYAWNCEATLEDLNSSFALENYSLTYDTTPPEVSITTPLDQEDVSGTITINAAASDSSGIASVLFLLDDVELETDTISPYETILDTTTLEDGAYVLTAVATDILGNSATSVPITINVNNTIIDTTSPEVSITSPTNNSNVSGTITVEADATDDINVSSVQFFLDGIELGTEITNSPYSISWNTSLYADGAYMLTATARDSSGNEATSEAIVVNVNNTILPPGEEETISLSNVADTFVLSSIGNMNFGDRSMIRMINTSSMTTESMFQWDLSNIPSNSIIVSAELVFTVSTETLSGSDSYTISSYRLLNSYDCGGSPWVETCPTWNTKPTASDIGTATDSVTIDSSVAVGNQYTWDITQIISEAYNEEESTASVYLSATDQSVNGAVDRVEFSSKEASSGVPVLMVTYTTSQ